MLDVVQFSGGKDSTAMLLMMLEKNMHIDEIVFCDVGKEFPEMYEHIEKVQKYIGREITILRSNKSYDYWMFEHVKARGKKKGEQGYGWANARCRWCTGMLKRDVSNKYFKTKIGYRKYIGIAYDEPERHENIPDNVVHPLYDWKITEKEALEYCYSHGFDWGGLYENIGRCSCWCCPLQTVKQLERLYVNYPDLWEQLKDMDHRSNNLFKSKGIDYYEARFEKKGLRKQPTKPDVI